MSTSIVRKALHGVGFYSHIAQKKHLLSNICRARRLEFAREHRKWIIEDWKKVIWTYKSTFVIGKSSRQILVWQKNDERYKLDCLTLIFKLGRTSIMIWGGFTATHKLSLICMPLNRRTTVDYVEILYDGVLCLFLEKKEGIYKVVLMEDGAPWHKGKVASNWEKTTTLRRLCSQHNHLTWTPLRMYGNYSEMLYKRNGGLRIRMICGWLLNRSGRLYPKGSLKL